MRTTPALLVRTALTLLLGQALVVLLLAAVIPQGAAWCVRAGFVAPWYDTNLLSIKLAPVPWTDPVVYVSLQTLLQMAALAMVGSALITLARTNPWERGDLADSAAAAVPKDKPRARPAGDAAADGPAPAPGTSPSPPAPKPSQGPGT